MTVKIKHFPGTPLSEKDFAEGKILFNHDELKANYAWDTGIGIGSYLAALKKRHHPGISLLHLQQNRSATPHSLRVVLQPHG